MTPLKQRIAEANKRIILAQASCSFGVDHEGRCLACTAREGMTLVPLKMYFNERGIVKVKIGVAKGKKLADKRETSAKRDWDRQKARLLKQGHQG